MKKHIYLFNEGSRASNCGVGTYVHQLVECFKDDDTILLNIVTLRSAEEFRISKHESYNVFHLPVIHHECNTIEEHQLYYRNAAYLIAEHIDIPVSDKLIFHFNTPFSDLLKILKKFFPDAYTVYTIHVDRMCLGYKGNLPLVKEILSKPESEDIFRGYEKQMFDCVDHIICLSNFMKELLLDYYHIPAKKVTLIHNGIKDERVVLSETETMQLKQRLFIPVDEKIILFVGRLEEKKGGEVLIDAFKKVVDEIPAAKLIIVGDGDFKKLLNLCEGLWNKIIFTGLIDKENLYQLYQVADVGVMPSFSEQCSYVVIEMMMYGLPIVGTTAPGLDEMIENREDKVQIEYNGKDVKLSSAVLAEHIVHKLKHKQTESNRDVYLRKYSFGTFKDKMKAEYNI